MCIHRIRRLFIFLSQLNFSVSMKLHLPVRLFRAIIAMFITTQAFVCADNLAPDTSQFTVQPNTESSVIPIQNGTATFKEIIIKDKEDLLSIIPSKESPTAFLINNKKLEFDNLQTSLMTLSDNSWLLSKYSDNDNSSIHISIYA